MALLRLWLAFALWASAAPQLMGGSQLSGSQLQQQLDAAVAARAASFALPKNGDVRFARGEGLLLSRAANMAIVGDNTTLWFQPGGGLRVLRCANISISGVVIDYDPLPFVQAEILAMAPAAAAAAAAPALRSPQQFRARRTLPAAVLAPCASPPTANRPLPPCPHGWFEPAGIRRCDQGCPSASQARNPSTGHCLCSQPAPNDKCVAGETCIGGQCSDASSRGDGAADAALAGQVAGETCIGGQCSDASSRGDGAAESALATQVWRLGTPFNDFVSNAASKSCLNVDDCKTDLIYDGCPAAESKDETTCAGKGNYTIFRFALEFADGNASHQQLRSMFGADSCVAAVAHPGQCNGCSGDPCTRQVHGSPVPCVGCSASTLCASPPPPPPTLLLRPCDPRDDSQRWSHTDLGQLAAAGLCLTAGLPPPSPPPPPPPPPRVKYTLRLAPRSNLFNFSCAKPNLNSSSPWATNASVCEHDGINQLFGSDRRAKIGSDFGSCAASQLPPLLCPGGAMSTVPSVGSYQMLNERDAVAEMPAMLDAAGASIARVGDFLTYSGRDWYTYTLANSSNVTTFDVTIHSSSGFTIVELDGECGHTYHRVNVVRREGYMIASNGDVFHSSDCARGATIEDSIFEAALDDFYNIHTTVHVAWTPLSLRSNNAADGVSSAVYIIQPRETGTTESVGPEVSEYWYGTASPMSSMRPGDSLSCFTFNTKSTHSVPVTNLTLSAFPQPVTNEAELASAAALGLKLQANAGSNRWVSLRLWKVAVHSSAVGALPLAVMCDLDRYSNHGFVARRNIFRDGGHPQIGGRVKSSGALIEGNTFLNNVVLNQEVEFLQSWLEGPTHIRDVLIRNNTYESCTAVKGGPPSAQPASFFSLCGPPYCHNNTQVGNIARPSAALKHDDQAPPIAPVKVPALAPPSHILAVCLFDDIHSIKRNSVAAVDRAELTMLNSLAGLLLRRGGAIGLYLEANVDARMVLQDLARRRSVTVTYAPRNSTAWSIARQLTAGTNITSFVLYDAQRNPQSTNVARMAVSVHHSLMVEASARAGAVTAGFAMAMNVSNLDDAWSLKNWVPNWEQLSGGGTISVALEQSNQAGSSDTDRVNDIASAFGALAFGDVGAGSGSSPGPTRDAFLSVMPTQGLVFGWPSYNEVSSIPDVSAHNKLYVVCEMSFNLALLIAYRGPAAQLTQRGTAKAPAAAPPKNKHFVAFHFTDGDNVEWIDGEHPGHEFYSSGQFWSAQGRGQQPLAWGIPTILSDVSRTVMEMLYETATPHKDLFVAVSPIGYGYVSKFSPEMRKANAAEQGRRMAAADLHILNLVDFRPKDYVLPNHPGFPKQQTFDEVYGPYTSQPTIDAVILYPWDTGYEGNGTLDPSRLASGFGSVTFPNGGDTPVITGRAAQWVEDGKCVPRGRYGCGASSLSQVKPSCGCRNSTNIANLLNDHATLKNATDLFSSACYSIIPVDVWTSVGSLPAILDTISQLDKTKVEVVGLDTLVEMVRNHVRH